MTRIWSTEWTRASHEDQAWLSVELGGLHLTADGGGYGEVTLDRDEARAMADALLR